MQATYRRKAATYRRIAKELEVLERREGKVISQLYSRAKFTYLAASLATETAQRAAQAQGEARAEVFILIGLLELPKNEEILTDGDAFKFVRIGLLHAARALRSSIGDKQ